MDAHAGAAVRPQQRRDEGGGGAAASGDVRARSEQARGARDGRARAGVFRRAPRGPLSFKRFQKKILIFFKSMSNS